VTIARAMMEFKDLAVIDEFTSVVDRTVAQIGSCAVAKTVRQRKQKLIAVACHYDIIEWMQPDWIYQPALDQFDWRLLRRRPEIKLKIIRAHRSIWEIFRKYHYMNTDLNKSAICFVALWNDKPVAFTAVIFSPHNVKSGWRGHRSVCLPDYQGVGIGNALANFVASLFKATGKPYRSTAAHPAVIRSRARSLDWHMTRKPSRINAQGKTHSINQIKYSTNRMTATFTYVGKAQSRDTAMKFGLMKK